MECNIDYGDIGSSLGVEGYLMKKKRRLEKHAQEAKCLNIDIKTEKLGGKSTSESFAVDLEWTSNRGEVHTVTGKDRNFFKAASEAFSLVGQKIDRSKTSFGRERNSQILDSEPLENYKLFYSN